MPYNSCEQLLKFNGLSLEILEQLSFQSNMGMSLKKDLRYFDKQALIEELISMTEWLDKQILLSGIALDYRIKSLDSILLKYDRYYPEHQARKVFNDILGFRAFCDDYGQMADFAANNFRVANMAEGKALDDGYRGVHVYYQRSSRHYPIEIQFNTLYDRQMNNWLHSYTYKKKYSEHIGKALRQRYEAGYIHNENDFKEALKDVLLDCKSS